MQQRVFLGNDNLIKSATNGLHPITHYTETGNKPCEDYVLECKREKSIIKLKAEFVTESNIRHNKYLYNSIENKLLICNDKEELIRFLNQKFKTLKELEIFFNTFNI